jgi:hypothetical protein
LCLQAHVKSKKYQELVKASGQPAPAPIIMMKQQQQPADGDSSGAAAANGEIVQLNIKASCLYYQQTTAPLTLCVQQ